MTERDEGIGERFQRETKYLRGGPAERLVRIPRPPPYKEYPGAARTTLPPPVPPAGAAVGPVIGSRRSVREFSPDPVGPEALSFLLWASAGIREEEGGFGFRTAPSAGALYPVETYVVANQVAGLERGIYHYDVRGHALEEVARGDFRKALSRAALFQEFCGEAAAAFVWTALFRRSTWKYGQRGYRYVYLDAGHIAQNLALAAVALGLGSCPVAAFLDDEMDALLQVDGALESVIYLTAAGVPG